jgi:hypothetical protein
LFRFRSLRREAATSSEPPLTFISLSEWRLRVTTLDILRAAVRDLHWMARRYADMRSSYAPSMFNRHTRSLLAAGVDLKAPHFARDGMGRSFDGLSAQEVEAAAEDMPRGFVPDSDERLAEALRALEALVQANDALAATRSQETYLSMIDKDGAADALATLDDARREACALLCDGLVPHHNADGSVKHYCSPDYCPDIHGDKQ